jgi:formate-dependent nitrite reductase complex subunit NrfG
MTEKKWPVLIGTMLVTGSLATYAWLGHYPQVMAQKIAQTQQLKDQKRVPNEIRQTRISALQEELYKDKQNAQLWYQLGHAYLLNAEYENAVTVFDYAIRLTKTLNSDHYASKATALYYRNKQQMSDEINALISAALTLNANNQTALMMLANEQFMQARYKQAITLWVKVLDSNQTDTDRMGIIYRINQAKQFIK